MISTERIVPDTSVITEGLISARLKSKEIKVNEILIHEAVLSELEHQANMGRSIGLLGLEELKELREISEKLKFEVKFIGRRPGAAEIRHASLGEVDSMIRDLAYNEDATLVTGDKVQSKVAEAKGIKFIYIEPIIKQKKLKLDKYFDDETMSVHLRENLIPYAKKGFPGNWKVVRLGTKKLTNEEIVDIAKEIAEEAKIRKDSFIEIERRGSSIIQLGKYRIVITRPAFSDAYEITAVKPIKQLKIEEYNLNEKLRRRIEEQAEGVLIAGSPGHGKSTFASALANFYADREKTVKTVEAPRDLQLGDNITQYAISYGSSQEIHDVLLLSRPDYTIFDELRNTEDFRLFADLRLSGIGLVGVLHATNPVDAIQRFIGRTELGVIPQVIDTVLFIKNGNVNKVLSLKIMVKVPSGMTEADLARPVVEIRDFNNDKLEYEIYSYGEETVVIPVQNESKKSGLRELASRHIENELSRMIPNIKAEVISENKAKIFVPEADIGKVIGKKGERINEIEKKLGISIDVESLGESKMEVKYNVSDRSKFLVFYIDSRYTGNEVDFYSEGHYLLSAKVGNKGEIKVHKKSKIGNNLEKILNDRKELVLKV